jgi:hypothetical protein
MGYTHYYTQKELMTDKEIENIVTLSKHIIKDLPVYSESSGGYYSDRELKIGADGENEGGTMVTNTHICLNGYGPEDEDLGHETFYMGFNDLGFEFCKTARKPYDYVVQAILAICHTVAPDKFDISSDGDSGEWQWSIDTASAILGIQLVNPIKDEDVK